MLSVGIHKAEVLSHNIHIAGTGTWGVFVKFKLKDSEDTITGKIWLSNKAYNIARKSLKAIGFPVDTESVDILDSKPGYLAGNECMIEIGEKTWKNKTNFEVKFINPIARMPNSDELADIMKGLRNAKKDNEEEVPSDIPF